MTNDQERAEFLDWHNNRRSSNQNAWAAWQARAAKPARPTPIEIAEYLKATGAYVTNDASRNAAIASAIEEAKLPVQVQEEAVAQAVAAEREACAQLAAQTVCDMHIPTGVKIYGARAAKAIRARGTDAS